MKILNMVSKVIAVTSFFLVIITSCTKPNVPAGMAYIEGGTINMGAENGLPNEKPTHKVTIKAFFIDKHPVTVAEFREFIKSTGYKTDAEKFGDAGVFDFVSSAWSLTQTAYWEYPLGTNHPKAADNHPVTQVSWNDATVYAAWAGKRLPTEAEWEFAARNGLNSANKYSWGNNVYTQNSFKANVWQGSFPDTNTVEDGFLTTSPVGYFGQSANGLSDMGGNVWQWCADTYKLYEASQPLNADERVLRGGSFLCDSNVCHGYRVSARTACTKETALMHIGFRCAKNVE